MIDVENVTFAYRRSGYVLRDFSCRIKAGGVYGLLGRNGSGKSTLLYLIAGLLTPGNGRVLFEGENTRERLPSTLSEIFIVPEEFSLPAISLKKYIDLYGSLYPRFSREDMDRYLKLFEMPSDIDLGALSMGQKKKVFMSFALACNTRLLLMDEPSNGLDIPGKSMFRRAVSAAASPERAIIISTHQVRDIDRILDHILILDRNRIVLDAPVDDIVDRLDFMMTDDPAEVRTALYAIPSIGGTAIVVRNKTGEPQTEINLETLFGFVLEHPDDVRTIFNEERCESSCQKTDDSYENE